MSFDVRRIFLKRSELALSRLLPADAAWLEGWLNDPVTTRFMATGRVQVTVEQVMAQIAHWHEPLNWAFTILRSDQAEVDGQYQAIGYVGLFDVDIITRKGEFRILIGAPHIGKRYGTEATKMALEFGFRRLGLQRIWLGVTDANLGAIRCYEKCGFRREGVLRRDLYRDGQFYDSIRMAILDDEYRARYPACLMDEAKPVETSGLGPGTPQPAVGPLMPFFDGVEDYPPTDPIPPTL